MRLLGGLLGGLLGAGDAEEASESLFSFCSTSVCAGSFATVLLRSSLPAGREEAAEEEREREDEEARDEDEEEALPSAVGPGAS